MSIQELKEPGGFWLPNEFIDVHAAVLGPRAVYLYCFLVRTCTGKHYPTLYQLSAISGMTPPFIQKCLWIFYESQLLNAYDMEKFFGSDFDTEAAAQKGRIHN